MMRYEMRGPYTMAQNHFVKSGQHKRTLSRFLGLVQGNGHGELYAGSKRCVIMFKVMRARTDIPGDAGFDEASDGVQRTQQSPGRSGGENGDYHGSKRRKKNVCEDTRFLCDHLKGLTDSISGHVDSERRGSESMEGHMIRDGNLSMADGEARHSNGSSEFRALDYMETRVKAFDTLERSYAQMVDAETENGGRDNPIYVWTKKTYDNIAQEFKRGFGSI